MRPVAGPKSSSRRTIIEIDSWIDLFLHSYFIRDDSLQSDEDWWNVVKVQKRTKFSSLSTRSLLRLLYRCCASRSVFFTIAVCIFWQHENIFAIHHCDWTKWRRRRWWWSSVCARERMFIKKDLAASPAMEHATDNDRRKKTTSVSQALSIVWYQKMLKCNRFDLNHSEKFSARTLNTKCHKMVDLI